MTTEEAKDKIFQVLIGCEIGLYMTTYGPEKAVISISNIMQLIQGLTKYRARLALKELVQEGLIEYTSQGCPAVVSVGEVSELVYDAGPPINGYCITKKGFETEVWKERKREWEKSMEEWANS